MHFSRFFFVSRLLTSCCAISLAPSAMGQSADSLRMQAFAQGKAKNCISVALIKAAIQRYGVGQVFDTLRTGPQVQVTLRDHTVLTLTDAERQEAAGWVRFRRPAPPSALPAAERAALVSYATFCYAVMGKYIQTKQLYGCMDPVHKRPFEYAPLGSYRAALRKLTKRSICSDNAYRHLGLPVVDEQAPDYSPNHVFSLTTGAVAYSNDHAVFVLGTQYDDHGTWKPLATQVKADDVAFEPKWYFELK